MAVNQYYQQRRVNFNWIGESFDIFRRDGWVWVGSFLISFLSSALVYTLFSLPYLLSGGASELTKPTELTPTAPLWTAVLQLVGGLVLLFMVSIFYAGHFVMANKAVRGEPLTVTDVFAKSKLCLPFFLYMLVFGIAQYLGILVCCVGFLFSWILLWPGFALLADGVDIGAALSRSINGMKVDATTGAMFTFVFFLIIGFGIVITCYLAMVIIYPMMFIVASLAYRDMIGMPGVPSNPGVVLYAPPNAANAWPPPPSQPAPPSQTIPASQPPVPPTRLTPPNRVYDPRPYIPEKPKNDRESEDGPA